MPLPAVRSRSLEYLKTPAKSGRASEKLMQARSTLSLMPRIPKNLAADCFWIRATTSESESELPAESAATTPYVLSRRPRKESMPCSTSPSASSRAPPGPSRAPAPLRPTRPVAGWMPRSAAPRVRASTRPPTRTETSSLTTMAFFRWKPSWPNTEAMPPSITTRSAVVSSSAEEAGKALSSIETMWERVGRMEKRGDVVSGFLGGRPKTIMSSDSGQSLPSAMWRAESILQKRMTASEKGSGGRCSVDILEYRPRMRSSRSGM